MDRADMIQLIKDVLDISPEVAEDTAINLFEYDSFAKVNLITILEAYSNGSVDLEVFLACDSIGALVALGDAMKNEMIY